MMSTTAWAYFIGARCGPAKVRGESVTAERSAGFRGLALWAEERRVAKRAAAHLH